jgi:hypothetical protein
MQFAVEAERGSIHSIPEEQKKEMKRRDGPLGSFPSVRVLVWLKAQDPFPAAS